MATQLKEIIPSSLPDRIFITGIGTDVGKSYATGWLARELALLGLRPVTQKFIQTGNKGFSEDIAVHRRIMGTGTLDVDTDMTTAPLILSYPAAPDLAAEIDGVTVDYSKATEATATLLKHYSPVLIEGAGGLLVPLDNSQLTADYIADNHLPAAIVTNGQLGSINHTLLTLHECRRREIPVWAVIYNPFFDKDKTICRHTVRFIERWLADNMPDTHFLMMPEEL